MIFICKNEINRIFLHFLARLEEIQEELLY